VLGLTKAAKPPPSPRDKLDIQQLRERAMY